MASIFEVSINDIPNFNKNGLKNFANEINNWSFENGYACIDIDLRGLEKNLMFDCYMVASGRSPRATKKKENHAVVWYRGKIIHDPHPSRHGLAEYPPIFTVFIPLNPKRLK